MRVTSEFRKLSLAAGLAAALAFVPVPGAQAVELSYNTYIASTHSLNRAGMEPFAERVARDSGGEVTFKLLTGGSVAKPQAGLDVMRDGIVDSSLVVDLYVRKSLPVSSMISDLALLGTDALVMTGAVSEYKLVHCEACRKDLKKSSSIGLAYYSSTPYALICRNQTNSPAEMASKKVRAVGPWAMMLKEFGMVPVNVSSGEIYEAMQRSQIDCSVGSDAWLKSYSLWDVARSVLDFPIGTYHGGMLLGINVDSWAKLSDKGRQAIIRNLPELVAAGAYGYVEEDEEARKGGIAKGVSFPAPTRELVDAIEAYKLKEVDRVVAQAEGAGIKNARAEVESFLKILDKWQKIVAEGKGDRAAYVAALEREVYSKAVFK